MYDDPLDLKRGDCFDAILDKDDQRTLAVVVKPCSEEHLYEAIGSFEFPEPGAASWPGQNAIDREAEARCTELFEEYVGVPFMDSSLQGEYLAPTKETWAGGDRLVQCSVVAHPAQPFTSSVRGSGR